jgi:hypothetical protein
MATKNSIPFYRATTIEIREENVGFWHEADVR